MESQEEDVEEEKKEESCKLKSLLLSQGANKKEKMQIKPWT